MQNSKHTKNKGILNEELLQRLDNANSVDEYDPYKPVKRSINQASMFSETDYESNKNEDLFLSEKEFKAKKIHNTILGLIIGLAAIALIGSIIYILTRIV